MRQEAKNIRLFCSTGVIDIATREYKALVNEEEGGLITDRLTAEVIDGILDFWTGQGDEPDMHHTYSGSFVVHWDSPGEGKDKS